MSMYEQTATSRLAEQAARAASQVTVETTPAGAPGGAFGAYLTPAQGLSSILAGPSAALNGMPTTAPRIDPNYQQKLTQLGTKYETLAPLMAAAPEALRNALIDYDASRVAAGSNPMTEEQTLGAFQAAYTKSEHTPSPERNPASVWKNFTGDLSDILKSIPRLPIGLVNEAKDLGRFGEVVAENKKGGMNDIAALLGAPGVRMIPGAYVARGVASGGEGLKDLATHPLMAALDILPVASKAAAGTQVGKLAAEASELAGKKPRPLAAVLTGKVVRDEAGQLAKAELGAPGFTSVPGAPLVDGLGRNRLGALIDTIKTDTRIGQSLDSFGGRQSRLISGDKMKYQQRSKAMFAGLIEPGEGAARFADMAVPEELARRSSQIWDRYSEEYPFLKTDKSANTPEMRAAAAEFWTDIQRDPSKYNPALVSDLRDWTYDVGKYMEGQRELGMFDNEWYDMGQYRKLANQQIKTDHTDLMYRLSNEYMSPSGNLTVDDFRQYANQVSGIKDKKMRANAARSLEHAMDAYGMDIRPMKGARAAISQRGAGVETWNTAVNQIIDTASMDALSPRTQLSTLIETLRPYGRKDGMAARLSDAVASGNTKAATAHLKSLYSRAEPYLDPALREDFHSMTRRIKYQNEVGRNYSAAAVDRTAASLENLRNKSAPARFDQLIVDERNARLPGEVERVMGRNLTSDEAGQLARRIQEGNWSFELKGMDADLAGLAARVEKEVARTWREMREAGADPVFVHRVSPARANAVLSNDMGVVPLAPSSSKVRFRDASPSVNDIVVSTRHQIGEILNRQYTEKWIDEDIIPRVGVREDALREQLTDRVWRRVEADPTMGFRDHMDALIRQQYMKFNPEEAGFTWGGTRLGKYKQESWYIPKAVGHNLKQYLKPPGLIVSALDPITKAFRFNVLGLSPSVSINNFFSNAVAMTAESGLGPFKYWGKAKEWAKDPSQITNVELRQMIFNEHPGMESISSQSWMHGRVRQELLTGIHGYNTFKESAIAEGAKRGVDAVTALAEKNYRLQMLGDQVYRAMQFMHEADKGVAKGLTRDAAEQSAMEAVRRTLVDYGSFTPIERQAMRTIIPFYSYMGHAARFIMRYPFDHPLRAAVTARIAEYERERLGGLPGSYLSMVPLPEFLGGGADGSGKENMLALRPFDAFGDISSMTTMSGWLSATNPVIQAALMQSGVVRGEAELYPTLRYDPETGTMKAVHGNLLVDMLNNTVPRAGLFTSALGLNPDFNELVARDPDAAKRSLVSMAGLPRSWRNVNPNVDRFKTELARQRSADMVRSDALKTGDWSEAARYPSLRPELAAVLSLTPEQLAAMAPEDKAAIAARVRESLGLNG